MSYVSYMPTCFTYSCALRAFLFLPFTCLPFLTCLTCHHIFYVPFVTFFSCPLSTFLFYVSYVLNFFTCFTSLYFFLAFVFTCFKFLFLSACILFTCFRFFMWLHIFYVPSLFFQTSVFKCLTCFHF